VDFPRYKIILGVLGMPGPQKRNWAVVTITQLTQKLARIANNQWKIKRFHLSHAFPLWPTRVLWIAMKGMWKK
jgi:hypothetical protein